MNEIEMLFHGRKLKIQTGHIAKQANGSALIQYGDTVVLVTACYGEDKGADFLPLTIDYIEKTYAAGKIPGGFFRREGKLSERETLISRIIDRPCRPLFPEGFSREVQVVATVLSADEENDPDVLATVGASAALTLSELPFEGPIAAVRVARIDNKLVINPKGSDLKRADLNMVVAGSRDAIVMVEGGATELPESEVLDALFFAHQELQPLIDMQLELQKQAGKPKMEVKPKEINKELAAQIASFLAPKLNEVIRVADKLQRRDAMRAVKAEMVAQFAPDGADDRDARLKLAGSVFEDEIYHAVRKMVSNEGRRIDGRDTTTVRPISIDVGPLPRTHGSAVFTRGETQAIVVVTLGTESEAQKLDNLVGDVSKTFLLHYNFPGFSVGEVKPMRGAGRREIGHGALAERAVKAVIPSQKQFPYVLRVVSEITESNGSSSMASVCGASLALMDAGVPVRAPVAGVAMGLIKEDNNFVILTDILGDEDHLGDMDFKVCGTELGITALQMDIKIKGLSREIMQKALSQAREGRLHILSKMNEAIKNPRGDLSKYAPRIVTIKINPDKIRDIIGPGGKVIRSIMEAHDVKIDVTDDGTVNIASNDELKVRGAIETIRGITAEAEVGKLYRGIVKRVVDFGAFVEVLPGTDGLVHISQLSTERVRQVTDVVREGDEVWVKVIEIEKNTGKIRLSMKEAAAEMQEQVGR